MSKLGKLPWRICDEGTVVDADGHYIADDVLLRFPDLLAMLKELEWAGSDAISMCPICGHRPQAVRNMAGEPIPGRPGFVAYTGRTERLADTHATDCRLASLLRECGE